MGPLGPGSSGQWLLTNQRGTIPAFPASQALLVRVATCRARGAGPPGTGGGLCGDLRAASGGRFQRWVQECLPKACGDCWEESSPHAWGTQGPAIPPLPVLSFATVTTWAHMGTHTLKLTSPTYVHQHRGTLVPNCPTAAPNCPGHYLPQKRPPRPVSARGPGRGETVFALAL